MAEQPSAKRARRNNREDGKPDTSQEAAASLETGTDQISGVAEAESAITRGDPAPAQRPVPLATRDGQEEMLQWQRAIIASRYINQNNHNVTAMPFNHVFFTGGAAPLPMQLLSWPSSNPLDTAMQPLLLPTYMGQPLLLQPQIPIPSLGSTPPLSVVSLASPGLGLEGYGTNATHGIAATGPSFPLPSNLEYSNASLIRPGISQQYGDMASREALARILPVAGSLQDVPPPLEETHVAAPEDEPPKIFPMALETDHASLSKYQCILRQQIEFFQATSADVRARAQGRNIPIHLRQVGIRCLHCARMRPGYRPRGAVYFPVRLASLYQSAQNMGNNHFTSKLCSNVPDSIVEQLEQLKHSKTPSTSTGGGGQRYWIQAAQQLGVFDSEEGTGLVYRKPT